jgi:NAD(P)-dependent dehydrogenase (short-subunit alcohol dehydrogenase family)
MPVALITGASRGLGLALAGGLADRGWSLVIDARSPDPLADAARELTARTGSAGTVTSLAGSVTDPTHRAELVDAATRLGGLDLLVNNAGKQVAQEDLEQITDEQFDHTLKTNVYAMFWLTKAAVPHLPAGSTIINTTSIQAYNPSPTLVDYATTKASINNFTKGLAQQLAPKGIRVNAVAPGPIWTPLQVSSGQPKEALPEFGKDTPLGRAGQPAELAPAYVFLASAESSYVVGETLNVNGGNPTP